MEFGYVIQKCEFHTFKWNLAMSFKSVKFTLLNGIWLYVIQKCEIHTF
jgi:hypothetical protein